MFFYENEVLYYDVVLFRHHVHLRLKGLVCKALRLRNPGMLEDLQDRPAREQRFNLAEVRSRRTRWRSRGYGRHNDLDEDWQIRRKIFPHGQISKASAIPSFYKLYAF